jgi:hypothetical protein
MSSKFYYCVWKRVVLDMISREVFYYLGQETKKNEKSFDCTLIYYLMLKTFVILLSSTRYAFKSFDAEDICNLVEKFYSSDFSI